MPQARRRKFLLSESFRARHERGAAIVEFAVVFPLLFALIFGMFETGVLWRESSSLTRIANQAARTISSLGTNNAADKQSLTMIEAGFASTKRFRFSEERNDKVITYSARDSSGNLVDSPPQRCLDALYPGPNQPRKVIFPEEGCAVYFSENGRFPEVVNYDPGDLYGDGSLSCLALPQLETPYWCEEKFSRARQPDSPQYQPPAVGVYIQVTYLPVTSIFGEFTITKNAVYIMEPCAIIVNLEDDSRTTTCEA